MSAYEDGSVVTAAVNGLHNDMNGEGENVGLKTAVSSLQTRRKKKNEREKL